MLDTNDTEVSPFISMVVPEVQRFVISESRVFSDDTAEQEAYLVNNYAKPTLSRLADKWVSNRCLQQPLIRAFTNDDWREVADDVESLNAYLSFVSSFNTP